MRKRLILALVLTALFLVLAATAAFAIEPNPLQIEQDHLILSPGPNGLEVQEVLSLNNPGNPGTGLLFPLPNGYTGLTVEGIAKEGYTANQQGIQFSQPLQPGQTQLILSYNLPQIGMSGALVKPTGFLTKTLLVVTTSDYDIQSPTLTAGETFPVNGVSYRQYTAANLNPGTDVIIGFSLSTQSGNQGSKLPAGYAVPGHPQTHIALFSSEPLAYTNPHVWAAYLFAMLALGLAAAVLWYRSRNRGKEEIPGPTFATLTPSADDDALFLRLKAKQDLLLQRLKSLDEDFETGQLAEEDYQATKNKYNQLLVKVKLELQQLLEA